MLPARGGSPGVERCGRQCRRSEIHVIHPVVPRQRKLRKLIVIAVFSFVWFLVALGRIARPVVLRLDVDCVMGLAATLQQGNISGRDFHYTYGPVAQLLAWAGTSLHQSGSAFDGFGLAILVWYATAALLFGCIILAIPGLRPLDCALLYLATLAFDLLGYYPFTDVASFRVLFVILAVVAVGRSLESDTRAGRRLWGAAAGTLCIVGQLTTIELGIQAAVAGTLLSLYYILKSWRQQGSTPTASYWETPALVLGAYAAGNLLISALFWISSNHYSFFDYQYYALQTIAGYIYGSALPWSLEGWRTAGLAALILYTVAAMWRTQARMQPSDRAVMLGMIIAAVLCLKNALIRSDVTHIMSAMIPTLLVFLLLGRWILPQLRSPRTHWKQPAAWVAMLALLYVVWPNNAHSASDFWDGSKALLSGELSAMRHIRTRPEQLLPPAALAAVRDSASRPMLNFPFEDHIGALLGRPMVAPVLQSFAANTLGLQQYYVRTLERPEFSDVEVSYSVDQLGAWPVDGVQTIARLPIIFKYFYRDFALYANGGRMLILRRAAAPRNSSFENLAFQRVVSEPQTEEIQLLEPTHCGLLRLELQFDYPFIIRLLKPAPMQVEIFNQISPVIKSNLIPLAAGRSFTTYLSLVPPDQFFRLFSRKGIPAPEWDRVRLVAEQGDWLTANPQRLSIHQMACVDGDRFVPLQ